MWPSNVENHSTLGRPLVSFIFIENFGLYELGPSIIHSPKPTRFDSKQSFFGQYELGPFSSSFRASPVEISQRPH